MTRITKKELVERLAGVPLFAHCSKRDLRAVARHMDVATYDGGVNVVTEGGDGKTFYLILQGQLEVVQGATRTAILGPGDCFGELSLLDPAPRSATVATFVPSVFGVLSVRMFKVLLREYPEISGALLRSLAGQLRDARRS